jgi:hypothetical protein
MPNDQRNKPPRPKITHSFPPPAANDAERFRALVRRLMKLGEKKKREDATASDEVAR